MSIFFGTRLQQQSHAHADARTRFLASVFVSRFLEEFQDWRNLLDGSSFLVQLGKCCIRFEIFSFSTRTCPHLLMRTGESLPQDSFPGVNNSIFKLEGIPPVVLFLWFMWEDVAITSKSSLFYHLRHLLCDCESSEKSDNEDRSPKTPFSFG